MMAMLRTSSRRAASLATAGGAVAQTAQTIVNAGHNSANKWECTSGHAGQLKKHMS